jgi:hypothetical protein
VFRARRELPQVADEVRDILLTQVPKGWHGSAAAADNRGKFLVRVVADVFLQIGWTLV